MSDYDRAQLPRELSLLQTEFSWYIFEATGRGGRHVAGLVSIHRTGPRPQKIEPGLELLAGRDLPAPLRDLVPSWLPVISPVRVERDDRPLVAVALYDLDRGTLIHTEHAIEHAALDLATFSVSAPGFSLAQGDTAAITASGERFALELALEANKPAVVFGDGSPRLVHGKVETCYVQRPRLAVRGRLRLDGETIDELAGDAAHDRQWMTIGAPNLAWIWPHLRLADGRELHGYVLRDSHSGRELGRAGWVVERDGRVRALRTFDVRAIATIDTRRGAVPTRFAVELDDLHVVLEHAIADPFLPMLAFGAALDAGIWESPARIARASAPIAGHCWVEVFDASTVRLR
ncbi:MAG: lipocalin-like domain-containing protein [Acidobacteriota bacterium]